MAKIHCRIITPEKVYKEFDADIITIETTDGQQGILPNHMPLVARLVIGRLSCTIDNQKNEYAIAGGLFYFRDNLAEILCDAIEAKKDIDVERANRAKDRATERINKNNKNTDILRAKIALKRALNRIRISKL